MRLSPSQSQAVTMISSHTSLLLVFLLSVSAGEKLPTKTIQTQLKSGQFVTYEEFDVAETDE